MQNIGERLEEARKRQGVSLREAAEATKVRTDFLTNFENNHFDFDVPDVYKRGFLRLYARFLKLDVDKVMTDYQAVVLGSSKHANRESKEFFGRMDLPDNSATLEGEATGPAQHTPLTEPHSPRSMAGAPAESMDHETDSMLYWKIGLPIGATAILALVGIFIGMWVSNDEPNASPTLNTAASGVVPDADAMGPTATANANTREGTLLDYNRPNPEATLTPLVISSRGDTRLWVRQENDSRVLYDQIIRAGEKVALERVGPVRVVSSDFHFLSIDIDGQVFHAQAEGVGQKIFY